MMRKEMRSKTCSLLGSSDLMVIAPIRPGLVPALDTVTYKARVKHVLRALHLGRTISHELDLARVMSDAVERVGRIHSARVAVIEPQDVVLLVVTFDGAWESYVRTIWQKVACLLDLIFCNTIDHVAGATHSYEEWANWIRRHQVEMPFAYSTPGVTTNDEQYLRMHERLALREAPAASELDIIRAPIPTAEEIAEGRRKSGIDPTNVGCSKPLADAETEPPSFRQGLRSLAGLYRLADWYLPGSDDGRFLLRAAQELLPEFTRQLETDVAGVGRANQRPRIKEALDWFSKGLLNEASGRRKQRPPPDAIVVFKPETVQAGILTPLGDCGHGVLAFFAFSSAAGLAGFLAQVKPSTGSDLADDQISINLALTVDGLRTAGLTEDELALLPEEFVLGMARRAGLLGDVRINHPSRWRMPVRNWSQGVDAPDLGDDAADRIEFDAVHVILQLRLCAPDVQLLPARQVLWNRLQGMVGEDCTPLSLQWLRRVRDPKAKPPQQAVDHFGFGDGISDPVFKKDDAGRFFANHVHTGEALVGYGNSADEPPYSEDKGPPAGSFAELLHNGSYFVIRKLRQDLAVLDAAVEGASGAVDRDTLLAKMMGRWPARHALASQPLVGLPNPSKINDFNYRLDKDGVACPFHAHIRRANPRPLPDGALQDALFAGRRQPRIFRRSLSYGEPCDRDAAPGDPGSDKNAERGLVFMAYNASIGEQFEVIQGWLSGGNSSGSLSAPDPFVGVAEAGRQRHYRFQHNGKVVRAPLDGSDALHDEPRPLVRLEWGVYAFAPSTVGLAWLRTRADKIASDPPRAAAERMPWNLPDGRAAIERLRRIEREQGDIAALHAWKAALEDVDQSAEFGSASIWAAIRHDHGGALRTPYGVLIGSRELVGRWMSEDEHAVSVAGYMPRMRKSFGPIFLGMDAGGEYDREVGPALAGIALLDRPSTFELARASTLREIDRLVALAQKFAVDDEMLRRTSGLEPIESVQWELTIDVRELVDHLLATFCEEWYGLSEEGGFFDRGGFSWAWRYGDPASYPGHFMAPSRAFFQPHPGPEVELTGSLHGQALARAMKAFLVAFGARIKQGKPAVREVLDSAMAQGDPTYAARTIIGMIMGFAPTVDGVLRRVIAQWGNDGTLWALRGSRGTLPGKAADPRVECAFVRAMQLRTTPESLWRTATRDFRLVGEDESTAVDVVSGDALVFGLMSATQQCLAEANKDVTLAFSGDRSALQRPTHACPGRDLALQMMLGFVHALVESAQPLRPGAAPSTLALEGRIDVQEQQAREAPSGRGQRQVDPLPKTKLARRQLIGKGPGPARQKAKASKGTVPFWAIGDSWLANLLGPFPDLVTSLGKLGYRVTDEALGHADKGFRLAQLARPQFLDQLNQDLSDAEQGKVLPKFILLGGGGNDIVEPVNQPKDTPLFGILKPRATKAEDAIDKDALGRFLLAMQGYYEKILDVLVAAAPDVPVFIHAYDHPIPDGRGFGFGIGPWLQRPFDEAKLTNLPINIDVMRMLIDALNAGVKALADSQQQLNRKVHYLCLAGVLESRPGFGDPKTDGDERYQAYWNDEFHPTGKGCDALAATTAVQLTSAGVEKPGSKAGGK
ncbi:MAG: hypothetical protein ABI702_16420 [Burkholderiales bacterium]